MDTFARPVRQYMRGPVVTVAPNATLDQAREAMDARHISAVAVVENDALVGVVSRTDLLQVGTILAQGPRCNRPLELPPGEVADLMTRDVLTVGPDDPVSNAARVMVENHVHRVFVLDGNLLTGVLSTTDMMNAVADARVADPIARYMSEPVITVDLDTSVGEAVKRLADADVRGIVVVDQDWPVGLFTQEEALEARSLPPTTPVDEAASAAMLCLDKDTPVHRAAAQAATMDVRRILAVRDAQVEGILTGLDLARPAIAR